MNRFLLLLLSVPLWLVSDASFAAPATMRVDYFHSGNHVTEMFSLDQVVIEPLPWTGNMAQPHDKTKRGKYLFEIVDPGSGKVAWSRSFSSIYGEWETTGEARRINRSFHESVRFPAQDSVFELVLKKRGADNAFEEIWRIELDPADVLVHRESVMFDGEVVAIHESGDPAQKVDLLLLGDGYTPEEHDKFIATARELTEILFATSPFRERKNDFNVWALAPAAAKSGISRPSTGIFRDSPIGATYDSFRSERYILTSDNKSMRRIASSAPYDFIEILTNSEVYGGGGIYGLFSTAAANSEWAPYLFVHEFGHHFAGLGDEYYTSPVAYEPGGGTEHVEPWEPNVTALHDPATFKWRDLVAPGTPIPTPWDKGRYEEHARAMQARRAALIERQAPESEFDALFEEQRDVETEMFADMTYAGKVGAFEGASYEAQGLYRPEIDCIMFSRNRVEFCHVCRRAIERIIDLYTGK